MDLPTVAYISSLEQFFITGGSPTTEAIMQGGRGNGKWILYSMQLYQTSGILGNAKQYRDHELLQL